MFFGIPIGIDTGEMVKKIHTQGKSKVISYFAEVIAKNFSCVELILRNSLKLFHFLVKIIGFKKIKILFNFFKKGGVDKIPFLFSEDSFPRPRKKINREVKGDDNNEGEPVILFESCVERIMDHPRKEKESLSSFHLLLKKGGYRVITPNQISSYAVVDFLRKRI